MTFSLILWIISVPIVELVAGWLLIYSILWNHERSFLQSLYLQPPSWGEYLRSKLPWK